MSPDYTVEILKGLMAHVLMVAGPLLLTGLCVGLTVSLFQAVTSLQEQTLTFVPKRWRSARCCFSSCRGWCAR